MFGLRFSSVSPALQQRPGKVDVPRFSKKIRDDGAPCCVQGRAPGRTSKRIFPFWLPLLLLVAWSSSPSPVRASLVPVVRPEPRSNWLAPLSNGPALAKFQSSINYLKQVREADRIIRRLEESDTEYRVEIVDHPTATGDPNFDGVRNLVTWAPNVALEWHGDLNSYQSHSPAMLLMYELGHAYHKEIVPERFIRLAAHTTGDKRWTNLEEKRIVLHVENPIAQALGEGERFFHENSSFFGGHFYAALAPTSTRHSPHHRAFLPLGRQTVWRDDARLFDSLHRALSSAKNQLSTG